MSAQLVVSRLVCYNDHSVRRLLRPLQQMSPLETGASCCHGNNNNNYHHHHHRHRIFLIINMKFTYATCCLLPAMRTRCPSVTLTVRLSVRLSITFSINIKIGDLDQILNGVMAFTLRNFAEFGSFRGPFH